MSNSLANAEQTKIKRGLRLRIGRLRRRINSRIRGSRQEGQRLLSWRTYVKRYPSGALAAAFGVGMAASTGLRGPRLIRVVSAMLVRRGAGAISDGVRGELQKIWEESTPTKKRDSQATESKTAGVDDGR
ncbi:MAG: hypothetical protein U9N87_04975 [Planctomycetota bacterium]|nr:hypothetical protein [Planctomycetota bacterium]